MRIKVIEVIFSKWESESLPIQFYEYYVVFHKIFNFTVLIYLHYDVCFRETKQIRFAI